MKTMDEVLDYLYSFINYETDSSYHYGSVHYNVGRTVKLLDLLHNPEREMDIIHVAGTKGKGSVCTIISSLLQAGRSITGMFTSPHIEKVNERISVNGKQIEDQELIRLINLFPPLIAAFHPQNKPTTFEILTAMAMQYFRMKGVKYGILETGMGGRFDSTNFSDPLISVITPISYDHMDKLGERIEDIAFEKAGIIKNGKPVVVGYQHYDVKEVFIKRAAAKKSPLYMVDYLCSYRIQECTGEGTRFEALIDGMLVRDLFFSLPGRHQVENAVTALLSLKVLGLLPEECAMRSAMAAICFPGRLESLHKKGRRFLLDSAHNEDSARVLVEAVSSLYTYRNLIAVVGIVKGKDARGILQHVASIADILIITDPVTHKELDTEYIFQQASSCHRRAVLIKNIEEAIEYSIDNSLNDDIVLITGSFYTISPARSILLYGL